MLCLGNICRSPMAETVLGHLAPTWTVDSAGIGDWHVGQRPDHRTLAILARHGLDTAHRARQMRGADFTGFDLILAMDRQNLRDLEGFRPAGGGTARIALLGAWDPAGESEVPDPYFDGIEAFAAVYIQIERCCRGLIAEPTGL